MKRLVKILLLAVVIGIPQSGAASTQCYGLFIGDSPANSDVAHASSLYGAPPCAILLFYDATWYPSAEQLNAIGNSGAVPLITIEPWDAKTKAAADLTSGYIDGLTGSLNEYGKEVYIRYAHEMNGNWYPWGGDPKKYIEDYRRFHSEVSSRLTNKNVKWIFSVNNESVPDTPANKAELYYPGDEYVDMIGIDGYLNDPSWWTALYLRFRGTLTYLFSEQIGALNYLNKPFIITETAISSNDERKAELIGSLFSELKKKYPSIQLLVWFDIKKEADWRIASGIKSLEFFRKGIKDRH